MARQRMSGQLYMTKTNCPKNILPPPPLFGDLEIAPPKVRGEWDRALSTIMQIFTPIGARYLSQGKNTYFPYRDSPGGYRSMLYIFGKLLSSFAPHLTCNAATYRF